MLKRLLLLIGCIVSLSSFAQEKDTRARLSLRAIPSDFHVASNGDCFVINRVGGIYKTNLNSDKWHDMSSNITGNEHFTYHKIYTPADNQIIISGANYYDKKGSILISKDSGKTFNYNSTDTRYVDALFSDEKNNVWAVDIEQNLYYSKDSGSTWSKQKIYESDKEKKEQRTSDIFFTPDGKTGYISTMMNLILKTVDNGRIYKRIPTPGDQIAGKSKAYAVSSIDKTRPIGKYYFTEQYHHIYMSDTSIINWIKVDSLMWFERTEDGGLIAITTSNKVALFDDKLAIQWIYDLPAYNCSLKCVRGNNLYLLTTEYDICSASKDGITINTYYSDKPIHYDADVLKYAHIDTLKGCAFLADKNDVMCCELNDTTWFRLASMKEPIRNMWKNADNLYVFDYKFNKFKIDIPSGKSEPYVSDLSELKHSKVTGFALQKEYGGCAGPFKIAIVPYKEKDNQFVKSKTTNTFKDKSIIKSLPEKISKNNIDQLFELVVNSLDGANDTIKFGIDEQDKENYRKYIDKLVKNKDLEENIKDFYYQYADSIDKIDDAVISKILSLGNPYLRTSTAAFNKYFVFNVNDDFLTVVNTRYDANYVCTPWIAHYKGEDFIIRSIKVGLLLDKITAGHFIPFPFNTKSYAMYIIADYFYHKQ